MGTCISAAACAFIATAVAIRLTNKGGPVQHLSPHGLGVQPSTSPLLGGSRLLNRQTRDAYQQTAVAHMRVEGAAAVARRIMAHVVDLDEERQRLAGGDATKNELLAEVELGFVSMTLRIQATMY